MTPSKKWMTVLLTVAGIYLFLGGNRGMWNLFKLHQEKVQLQKEVDRLKAEIRSGRAEYQVFKNNPQVIEKQAREDLNLVKPGEMIYRFSKGPASR